MGNHDQTATLNNSLRILIVDDNAPTAETLALIVECWGHQSRVVLQGAQALAVATRYHPHVILMDLSMPGMDGFQVARALRQSTAHASTVLVAMTGHGQDEDKQGALQAGFDHFFVKPVEPDALKKFVDRLAQEK
jgi:CheY-like chemotaxis protein